MPAATPARASLIPAHDQDTYELRQRGAFALATEEHGEREERIGGLRLPVTRIVVARQSRRGVNAESGRTS